MPKKTRKKQQVGPSVTSKVTDEQQEWHTVSSDDEEAYATEMEQLYKD